MKRKNIKIIFLVLVLSAIYIGARLTGLHDYLDEASLKEWISGYGVWAPVVYILVYSIGPSLMMPGLPLTVAGGVVFGPLWGSVYTIVGATIGATVAFLVARALGRARVEAFIADRGAKPGKPGKIEELDNLVKEQGWKVVAITRLIPLFPYNFLNYAFGLTGIKTTHYVIASFLFMIPGAVAYVVFSSSIFDLLKGDLSVRLVSGIILIVLVTLASLVYKRLKKPVK